MAMEVSTGEMRRTGAVPANGWRKTTRDGAVLITGASSGIGRACALRLAAGGRLVIGGVRRPEDGEALERETGGMVTPVLLDVTREESVAAARDEIRDASPSGLFGLVNNAGISRAGPLEHVDLEHLREQLEVNVIGQLAVTQACLDLLRAGEGRRIVFVGSIGGRLSAPYLGPYSASKHAIVGLADTLRRELRDEGIHVALIEPGAVATDMLGAKGVAELERFLSALPEEGRRRYGSAFAGMRRELASAQKRAVPPDRVAARVEHALTSRRPRVRYVVGVDARLQSLLAHVPDAPIDAVMSKALGGRLRRPRAAAAQRGARTGVR